MNMRAHFIRHLEVDSAEQAAWFLVWFSLPFSLKISGAAIMLASFVILVAFIRQPFYPDRRKVMYLLLPVLLFLWHARELFSDHPFLLVWKETERLLSFVVLPCLFALGRIRKETFTKTALTGFISALVICGIIMLAYAATRFYHSGNWNEFIYHNLTKPFHTGAIYFSFYLLFALFKIDDPVWLNSQRGLKVAIAGFLLLLFLLCASKLLIGLGIPLLLWHDRRFVMILWKKQQRLTVALSILIILGLIPFMKRAQVLIHPNLEIVRSLDYSNAPEPNGLNLRLILCRFGMEILNEQKVWFTGTGMTLSQDLLNQKIIHYHMYTGTSDGTNMGYLNYNFHNQFMETLVRTGVPGLVILIAILITFTAQPAEYLFAPKEFVWLISGFLLTESVLERQAGIVLFCLIIFAIFITKDYVADPNER